jgi:nucleotide-binding universal stress UspA family protein
MFKQILLPVDLTDKHRRALDLGAELALQSGGTVTLLHVIEVIPGLSMDEERNFYRRLEQMARAHLGRLGQPLAERRVLWRAEVRYGHRAPECARYAAEAASDLIILTAPRFDPDHPAAGWGSMSYRIGLLAPCPVLLVK